MQPQQVPTDAVGSGGALIALLGALLLFAFLIVALMRARKRRQREFDALERREMKEPPPDLQAEEKRGLEALEEEALAKPTIEKPAEKAAEKPVDAALERGLKRTHDGLLQRLGSLFSAKEIPADLLQQVETILLTSDLGIKTTQTLLANLKEQLSKNELKDQRALFAALEKEIAKALEKSGPGVWQLKDDKPMIVLMVGVNGVGKTTTIGKLAAKLRAEGKSVMLAAGDTFRAAAADQLKIWAERAGAEYYAGAAGKDPASVIFEACQKAKELGIDVVLADTAGRLHTKTNLMEELKKVKRVIGKVVPNAPHDVFLVVDATTGQNAVNQAREFNDALGLTGIILTKLDGTAKGGVVVAIAAELGMPIRFIGVGETAEDLKPFDPDQFTRALFRAA